MTAKIIAGIGILLVLLGVQWHVINSTQEWVTVEIWDKERECRTSTDADGATTMRCRYVVHTDVETFTNKDTLLALKFNSSDVHRNLREGETYEVLVYGWRIPWASSYRNIIDWRKPGESRNL
jgi:hypothetical protein